MKIIERVKNPSLELNWLPNSFLKGLPTPNIALVSDSGYSGAYYQHQDYAWDDMDLRSKPLIIIDICITDAASTIAHEMRHHWQYHNGIEFDNVAWNRDINYYDALIEYYTKSYTEFDALRFERKFAPDEDNEYIWMIILKKLNRG